MMDKINKGMIFCSLLNDATIKRDYTASNVWMIVNNEFEILRKKWVMA
jgi:hypothetical protein